MIIFQFIRAKPLCCIALAASPGDAHARTAPVISTCSIGASRRCPLPGRPHGHRVTGVRDGPSEAGAEPPLLEALLFCSSPCKAGVRCSPLRAGDDFHWAKLSIEGRPKTLEAACLKSKRPQCTLSLFRSLSHLAHPLPHQTAPLACFPSLCSHSTLYFSFQKQLQAVDKCSIHFVGGRHQDSSNDPCSS